MGWLIHPKAKAFIAANKTVQHWFDRLGTDESRDTLGHKLEVYCQWAKKTPDELIEEVKNGNGHADPEKLAEVLDRVEDFILHGEVQRDRLSTKGNPISYTIKLAEISAVARKAYLVAIRSFYSHNKSELPHDAGFKIRDEARVTGDEEDEAGYITLDQAKAVIAASKEPYKTLFQASLYGGLERSGLLLLDEIWPKIQTQLASNQDVIRVDFLRRKNNPKPYFTLLPSSIFLKWKDAKESPFTNQLGKRLSAIDINIAWRSACKRAGIEKPVTLHNLRDFMRTAAWGIGMDDKTAEFLLGHKVDDLGYLQLRRKPEKVQERWQKYRQYLESGVSTEEQEKVKTLESTVQEQAEIIRKMQHDQDTMMDMIKRTSK